MGVLDDAIRQHIELKRLHGAGEDELKRKEQEALGPARREAAGEPEDAGAEAAGDPPADLDDTAATAKSVNRPFDEQETPFVLPSADEQAPTRGPLDDGLEADDEPRRSTDQDPVLDERDTLGSAEPPAPFASEDGDEPEDVLEETPEFLQETPEHDRLWFEQKPPRDFDFDDK